MMEQGGKRRTLYSWLALGVFLLLPPISFGDFPWYTAPLGALVLFFAVWVLRRLGISFDTEALAEAHILKIFTANTPLSVLSFLR